MRAPAPQDGLPTMDQVLCSPWWTTAHVATFMQLPTEHAARMACKRLGVTFAPIGRHRLTCRAWVEKAIRARRKAYRGGKGRPPKALQPLPTEAGP